MVKILDIVTGVLVTDQDEIDQLLEQLGITREWELDNVMETAMNRHHVRKGQRQHVKDILNETFTLLRETRFLGKKNESS